MNKKQQLFDNIVKLINETDKQNYLEYYNVFRKYQGVNNIPTDEKEEIIQEAYKKYKKKEKELQDIYDHARMDLMKGLE